MTGRTETHGYDGVESLYYERPVDLLIGGDPFTFDASIDLRFGTDAVLRDQDRRKDDALRDYQQMQDITHATIHGDLGRLAFDTSYWEAFQTMARIYEGPRTSEVETLTAKHLTDEQIVFLENVFMTSHLFIDVYGFRRHWAERLRGRKLQERIRHRLHFTRADKDYPDRNEVLAVGGSKYETYSLAEAHNHYKKPVKEAWGIKMSYDRRFLSLRHQYLTCGAKAADAIDLINRVEAMKPEDRLRDFLEGIKRVTKGDIVSESSESASPSHSEELCSF